MRIYALRNDAGEYISMSGDRTLKWLEASKFDESQVESRLKYANPEFKLVTFEVKELIENATSTKEENDVYWLIASDYYGNTSTKITTLEEAEVQFHSWCEGVYDYDSEILDEPNFSETITLWKVDKVNNDKTSVKHKVF